MGRKPRSETSMEDSLNEFLDRTRAQGELDSEGVFRLSLESARRKLAEFGQSESGIWTLQFAQAFYELGCRNLQITEGSDSWFLAPVDHQVTDPGFVEELKATELSFEGRKTPAQRMILGLCGVSQLSLERAVWCTGSESFTLLGPDRAALKTSTRENPGLRLLFKSGAAPPFPAKLWRQRLSYSPLQVQFQKTILNRETRSPILGTDREAYWLEYLFDAHDGEVLDLRPAARPNAERFPERTDLSIYGSGRKIRVRWWEDKETKLVPDAVTILVRDSLTESARFHPIKSGCLLESFEEPDFPEGFDVIFSADECDTDLGQMQLLDNAARRRRVQALVPLFKRVLEILFRLVAETEDVVKKKRTPIMADLGPGFMGIIGIASLLGSIVTPILLLPAGLLTGLPGFYFWYSRKSRRKEFTHTREVLLSIIEERRYRLDLYGKADFKDAQSLDRKTD
jgi:hypothetical protein